jgi:hypothetical protein
MDRGCCIGLVPARQPNARLTGRQHISIAFGNVAVNITVEKLRTLYIYISIIESKVPSRILPK